MLDPRRGMFEGTWKDIRCATRSLRRTPGFTATAIVMLALGIGANTAIFTLVNALVLRTLPLPDPGSLVFVGSRNAAAADSGVNLLSNPAWLQRIRRETAVFAGVAAYNVRDFKVASAGAVEQVVGQYATGNYHALLGVPMALGRGFANENDFAAGSTPIAVISDNYWRRHYQRRPNVLGEQLTVGGRPVTIVGVTAAGFEGLQPGRSIDVSLPLSIRVEDEPGFVESLDSWTNMPIVARLKPGVTAAAAEPIVHAAYREHMSRAGIGFGRTRDGRFILSAAVVPAGRGADRLRREYEPALRVLGAIVLVVLLIACVNVANLFLGRSEARAGEVAMRLAVGASRWRIARELLTEAALVAAAGGLFGFVAATWAARSLGALLLQSQRPVSIDLPADERVFLFTLIVSGVATLLFGVVPAIRAPHSSLPLHMARAGSTTTARSRGRLILVAAQLALCVVLVFGAGLLVRTLQNLKAVDDRFTSDAVVAFAIDANDSGFPLERMGDLCTEALGRLRQPGVVAASCSTMTPLDTAREVRTLGLPAPPPGSTGRDVLANAVSPGYFVAFGIDSIRGRLFTDADDAGAARVAILNEAAARHFFVGQDPIGRQIAFGSRPDPAEALTVVGIVRDIHQELRATPEPMVYQPLRQMRVPPDYVVGAIRTTDGSSALATRIRGVVRELSPQLAVGWVRTLREQMDAALVRERLLASLSVGFGLLALVLAGTGVYGVIAYDVARRTREIGIRLALGARRRTVIVAVVRQTAAVVVPGVAIGLAGAVMASALVETFLFGITPRDPATLGMSTIILGAIALVAAYVPARRAARVNPATALRAE